MPEMPEVETLVRKLRRLVIGKQIEDVRLSGMPLRKPVSETVATNLRGRTIKKVLRRGKYLIVELEPRSYWLIHLGMSGRILYQPETGSVAKHTHAVICFSDSTRLEYRDPRRFGLLAVYDVARLSLIPELRFLGRDPLGADFKAEWLHPLLKSSRQEIKSFLLNQHKIAGLGNIYACEALFHARIQPARRCCTLTSGEADQLARAIRKVLAGAIRGCGTSFSDFIDLEGKPGKYQNYLMVFQKEGEQCIQCKSVIRRIKQGNRSTFFCPRCQI
jgi:formamidopyrimidine-DNA glycosylase